MTQCSTNKERRYEAICCKCNSRFYATKSILQEMGVAEGGTGRCINCNALLNLTYDENEECMKTMDWQQYVDSMKGKI